MGQLLFAEQLEAFVEVICLENRHQATISIEERRLSSGRYAYDSCQKARKSGKKIDSATL
jgi:hypothetical protein